MYYLLLICDLLFFRLITELVCQRTHRGRACALMYMRWASRARLHLV